MTKNIKIAVGLIYILCLGLILYGFFIFVDVTQLNDYKYIRDKTQFLIAIKDQNSFWFTILFFLFSIIWILLLGFATPISLISGFLFGKFYGTLISVLGFTFGCTLLYILANQYFKDIILDKLSNKISKFKDMFKFLVLFNNGDSGILYRKTETVSNFIQGDEVSYVVNDKGTIKYLAFT